MAANVCRICRSLHSHLDESLLSWFILAMRKLYRFPSGSYDFSWICIRSKMPNSRVAGRFLCSSKITKLYIPQWLNHTEYTHSFIHFIHTFLRKTLLPSMCETHRIPNTSGFAHTIIHACIQPASPAQGIHERCTKPIFLIYYERMRIYTETDAHTHGRTYISIECMC